MNIGQAAQASGISAKMIRHYEKIGLISKPQRTLAGYRVYDSNDLQQLRFIKQARHLGFAMEQIRSLLILWKNPQRSSREVKQLALQHIHELDLRISELQQIRQFLQDVTAHCAGDHRAECPILEQLSKGVTVEKTDCL